MFFGFIDLFIFLRLFVAPFFFCARKSSQTHSAQQHQQLQLTRAPCLMTCTAVFQAPVAPKSGLSLSLEHDIILSLACSFGLFLKKNKVYGRYLYVLRARYRQKEKKKRHAGGAVLMDFWLSLYPKRFLLTYSSTTYWKV